MAESVEISIIAVDAASNILNNIGQKFGALGQIAVAALTAAGSAMGFLISQGVEAQDTMTRFNALIKNSPLSGYKDQMLQMADALSKTTRFEADNIVAAESQLSVYQNIGQKIFPDVLKATLDLATFMKTDATSSAQMLGRAFEDISGGSLTMLARQRLLTKEQVDFAKELDKSGKTAEAQTYVLKILNERIGGLAESMGANFMGKWDIFNNKLKESFEQMGMKLLPVLEPVIDNLSSLADTVLPLLSNALDTVVIPALKGMVAEFDNLIDMVKRGDWSGIWKDFVDGLSSLGNAIVNIDWKSFSENLASGINSIDWAKAGIDFSNMSKAIGEGFLHVITTIDWGALAGALGNAFTGVVRDGIGRSIVQAWTPAVQQFWQIIYNTKDLIASAILGWIGDIENALRQIAKIFYDRATGWVNQAALAVKNNAGNLMKALQGLIIQVASIVAGVAFVIPISLALPGLGALESLMSRIQALTGGAGGSKGYSNLGGTSSGGGGGGKKKQHGGIIDEPVVGIGLRTGQQWSFAEDGKPEMVLPNASNATGMGGGGMNINLYYQPMFSAVDAAEFENRMRPFLLRAIRNARASNI